MKQILFDELKRLQNRGQFSEKIVKIIIDFIGSYEKALQFSNLPFEPHIPLFQLFLQLILDQIQSPHSFDLYHKKIRHPIDYYQFSLDLIKPLVDLSHSSVINLPIFDEIESHLKNGDNVIFFANHQIEPDPQAISILLEKTHPNLAEKMIYIAGERVVSDPLAIPFSLGCDLLCIYSKRYIDYPPEQKEKKLLHNRKTMEMMCTLLQEGSKAIYVAPSGGRDRKNEKGELMPAPFDPNSVEMLVLMAQKAKKPAHFYPLALNTYNLFPPPESIQRELGEMRTATRSSIGLSVGNQIEMAHFSGATKEEKREKRSMAIWTEVCHLYQKFPSTASDAPHIFSEKR